MSGETDKNLTSSDYYRPNKTKKTRNHKANKSDAVVSKEVLPSDVNAALSKKNNQNFQLIIKRPLKRVLICFHPCSPHCRRRRIMVSLEYLPHY